MLKDEWLTPPEIITELGPFDLDPCAPVDRPWDTAKKHYTIADNGLLMPWLGYIWCNPPYGLEAANWLERMAMNNHGIALIFARTETSMFFNWVWNHASALLFIRGRLYFYHSDGTKASANAGAPSVLVAYGKDAAVALRCCSIEGKYIKLKC